jgi:hypothetical protein
MCGWRDGQLHHTLQGHGRGGASALRGGGIDRGAHRGPGGLGATTHAQLDAQEAALTAAAERGMGMGGSGLAGVDRDVLYASELRHGGGGGGGGGGGSGGLPLSWVLVFAVFAGSTLGVVITAMLMVLLLRPHAFYVYVFPCMRTVRRRPQSLPVP